PYPAPWGVGYVGTAKRHPTGPAPTGLSRHHPRLGGASVSGFERYFGFFQTGSRQDCPGDQQHQPASAVGGAVSTVPGPSPGETAATEAPAGRGPAQVGAPGSGPSPPNPA